MNKSLLLTLSAVVLSGVAHAQFSEFENSGGRTFTITGENSSLQIGGRTSGYYEYRTLKTGETNLSHNGWALKDMDLDFLGRTGTGAKKFEYEFHISPIDMVTAATTLNSSPQSPGIKAAYLQYLGCPVHIKFGYDKLPFSQGNISDVWATPYWSHANLYSGDLFSRRDWGLTFNYQTWMNRINLYAGAYSGMGETFFEYGNDQSGSFEYVGRAEFNFPAEVKYRLVDEEVSPKPQFRIAGNVRYFDKTQPTGAKSSGSGFAVTYPDAIGTYGINVFDGKRLIYGGDFLAKYKGLTFTFEADVIKMQPHATSDPVYEGTTPAVNANVVNAGGIVTGLSYNYEPFHSVLAVQYENFNANDLVPGTQEWLNIAYAYKVSGFNSVFKIEYYIPTTEDKGSNPLKYTAQLRAGYQIVF